MKIALVAGGQPRFTPDFVRVMHQLEGFDTADLYIALWESDWARDDDTARAKIQSALLPNYQLAKVKILPEPEFPLPAGTPTLEPAQPENVMWWYKRGYNQSYSLALANDLIDQQYDLVIKIRLDGSLDRQVNLRHINIGDDLVMSPNGEAGWPDFMMNEQFVIGRQDRMKLYFDLGYKFAEYVPISDPNWYNDHHGSWRGEWLSGTYMKKNGINRIRGEFNHDINRYGRSRFTDKHYHHGIAPDPTEQRIIFK